MTTDHLQLETFSEELLELPDPWRVDRIETNNASLEIFMHVSCRARATLTCPNCGFTTSRVRDMD